jgi:predicted nucleic acid-binding protein
VILVDAGPLIGLLSEDDQQHERCVETLRSIREPLGTAWPVLTEAMYLLGTSWQQQDRLWDMIDSGGVRIVRLDAGDAARMRELMRKYRDLPMDLVDAALVRIAEREGIRRIFTLDRRDFSVYRPAKLERFSVIP